MKVFLMTFILTKNRQKDKKTKWYEWWIFFWQHNNIPGLESWLNTAAIVDCSLLDILFIFCSFCSCKYTTVFIPPVLHPNEIIYYNYKFCRSRQTTFQIPEQYRSALTKGLNENQAANLAEQILMKDIKLVNISTTFLLISKRSLT